MNYDHQLHPSELTVMERHWRTRIRRLSATTVELLVFVHLTNQKNVEPFIAYYRYPELSDIFILASTVGSALVTSALIWWCQKELAESGEGDEDR